MPGSVLYEPADVTNEDEVARVVEAATAWTGRLHGVVHCAGGSETIGPVTQIDSEAWRRTVDLNINGTMYVLKHAAREMVRGGGGSFIGISSIAASNTHRWFGAYGVSKAGIDHLMQLAADELGASWVRVNCIRPGLIRTELVAPVLDSPELSADYAACTPLPRPGEVEDIANARGVPAQRRRQLDHRPGDQRRRRPAGASRPGLLGDARAAIRRRRPARSRDELADRAVLATVVGGDHRDYECGDESCGPNRGPYGKYSWGGGTGRGSGSSAVFGTFSFGPDSGPCGTSCGAVAWGIRPLQ